MRKLSWLYLFSGFALAMALFFSCKKTGSGEKYIPTSVELEIPPGWPDPVYDQSLNPLTKEGISLGRKLFYDGILSKDGFFPCSSCHQQFSAFATYDHDLSHGFNNQFTTRNAPGLYNLAWHKEFHWDGGINHLEVQPLAPITAPNEMAEDINTVIQKLSSNPEYPTLFRQAFGDETVNSQRMLKALAQFMASMVSANAKYDRVKRGDEQFTPNEAAGYAIFQAKCATCHQEPLFTDLSYRNTGLPVEPYFNDYGRMGITNDPADSLKFKVPSLRNLMLTFPYGHDGRFVSVGQVLEHYNSGVQVGTTTDPLVKNGIPLSYNDRFYLMQFFWTLTDSTFIKDKQFGAPGY